MKQLKISFSTGKIEVPDLPGDDATAEEKNARALALLDETNAELDGLDKTVDAKPREALLQAWILQTWLEAHPKNWLSDFGKRRERNALDTRLGELRDRAIAALPGDEGQTVWDDLPYVRTTLELLFAKQRTSDEVKRLILSPLGKLKNANIDYQRQGAEDLARVCADISQIVRDTAKLDDEVKSWGLENREALLLAKPPVKIPASRVDSLGTAKICVVVAGLLIIAGGAITAGMVTGVANTIGFGLLAAAFLPLLVGVMIFKKVSGQKAAVPAQFAELSQNYRERLYLICCLRTLFQLSSRYTVTDEAFRTHLNSNGGKTRWKKIKFEARDLTELFATESWDPRGTVEHWLAEKVKTTFRLDSTKLIGPEDLDVESWDVLLRAYLLESIDSQQTNDTDAKLLDTVSEMLFVKRGEDIEAEKQRVFEQVRTAWAEAERAEGRAL